MILSPARNSTAAELLRLAAVWLVVILALQGWHAARAGARGPLHHHADAGSGAGGSHFHAGQARHFHAQVAPAAVSVADADRDDLAFALTAALALLAVGPLRRAALAPRPVWRAAAAWQPRSIVRSPPTPPPRAG